MRKELQIGTFKSVDEFIINLVFKVNLKFALKSIV